MGAWKVAMSDRSGPVALVLTRQPLPILAVGRSTIFEGVQRGGYIIEKELEGTPCPCCLRLGGEPERSGSECTQEARTSHESCQHALQGIV